MKPFKNFECFLNVSQKFVFFVQTLERLTHTLLIFFEKYANLMHLLQFSLKTFEHFRKKSSVVPPNQSPGNMSKSHTAVKMLKMTFPGP